MQVTSTINKTVGFPRKPLAALISTACLQLISASALAASCPAAVSGIITASGSYDTTCVVGAGEHLQVTGSGTITVPNSNANAVLVDTGVTANLINNAGSITSPYQGSFPPYLDAIHLNAGATLTNGIVNSGSVTADSNAIAIDGATLNGGIQNTSTGTIQSTSLSSALQLTNGAQLSGGVDNSGAITGGRGIYVDGSTLNGTIQNRLGAHIEDITGAGYGILVENHGQTVGNILNAGSIDGGEGAIVFRTSSALTGNITNTGTIANTGNINAPAGGAIFFDTSSTLTGNIDNQLSGLIDGGERAGIAITGSSTLTGSILNAGTITAGINSPAAINIDHSTITGTLNNSGTISDTDTVIGAGILLANGSSLGALVNSGTVTATNNGVDVEGSTIANGITNTGTITSQRGIVLDNSAVISAGGISNSGHITSQSIGVVVNNSTLSGGITNFVGGTIAGDSQGISISDSTVTGNIDNSGLIDGLVGLWIRTSTLNGDIINRTGASITDSISGYAILASDASVNNINNSGLVKGTNGIGIISGNVTGAITNNAGGTITADNGDGIQVRGLETAPAVVGSIANSGTITGKNGIRIEGGGSVTGAINNASGGTITATTGDGIQVSSTDSLIPVVGSIANAGSIAGTNGINIQNGTVTGAIANNNGGIITATANGIQLSSTAAPTSAASISNGGTINGAKGIAIYSGASVAQGIANSGTINGSSGGIEIGLGAALTGGINNSGTIVGGNGTGILVQDASFAGNIANSGTISGATAIDISSASGAIAIDNSGTLNGAVSLGAQTLNLNGSNSHVNGAVSGAGSTVNINGTFTSANTFEVGTFNIAASGVFNAANPVTASAGVHNFGTVSVKAAQPFAVTGDYTQSAGGVYLMQASSPTQYSKMTVSGSATLAPLTHIAVDVTQGATLIANGVLPGVITASSLSASTFTVTDNSVLFNFTGVVNGNAVDLNVLPGLRVYDTVIQNNNFPGAGAAQVFDSLIQGGNATGDMATVISALGSLTTSKEVSDAVQQTLPLLTGGTTQAIFGTLDSTNKIIQARQDSNLGLSSGDDFLTDRAFWLKPFGSWSRQSERKGVPGYETNGGGLIVGADGGLSADARLGAALSYARTALDSDNNTTRQTADIDTYQAVVYGTQTLAERTDLNYQVDLGTNKTNGDRYLNFGSLQRKAAADYSGWSGHIGTGIGHLYTLNDSTSVTPSVRIDYTALKNRSYTESGAGALNLNVKGQTTDQLVIGVDAKLNYEIEHGLIFSANAGAGYDTYNKGNSITSAYAGGGAAFVTEGLDPSPWIIHGGFGLIAKTDNGLEITSRYDVESRSTDFHNQTVSVKFRMPF